MRTEFLSIGEAAKLLGVSIDTLRRWDQKGKLIAVRTEGGHRKYRKIDIDIFLSDLSSIAKEWVSITPAQEIPGSFYCSTSAIFQARLSQMEQDLFSSFSSPDLVPLIVAIAGEIGNNSFDHNIGNWPDVPGVLFGYDLNRKQIALADRGQGILETLKRVKPKLANHAEALGVAFTEIISGREPEKRGNGLKFVRIVIQDYPLNLIFQTGDATLTLKHEDADLHITANTQAITGCLALISF